ncbi:MAG TPA: guanine deaminase [Oribacterium sp.]|jgi:guanine deaminase|nr:guanine deaminase [Oribacterium sp.]
MDLFTVKGDFYDCDENRKLRFHKDQYMVVKGGQIENIYPMLPDEYKPVKLYDFTGRIIMPGLVDLHNHAPQYSFRGMGMELELLDWLNTYTFPEESHYKSQDYADKSYQVYVDALRKSYTTRASIFGTIYTDTTLLLMDKLEKTGLRTYVGKVNMDRNSPDYYIESTGESLHETERFLKGCLKNGYQNTRPIITPRFIPSCSDDLMMSLSQIHKRDNLPVQSHLSENRGEITWVKELAPDTNFYGEAYEKFGMIGKYDHTIMAHCVSSSKAELDLLQQSGCYVAHCPSSNINLSSGIAPIRRMLSMGINLGLGTDVAAGESLNMASEIVRAVQVSKMRWRYIHSDEDPITIVDAFYMATRGGGSFFGKVGAFEPGYSFDACIVNDSNAKTYMSIGEEARFTRMFYLNKECRLEAKFVDGKEINLY